VPALFLCPIAFVLAFSFMGDMPFMAFGAGAQGSGDGFGSARHLAGLGSPWSFFVRPVAIAFLRPSSGWRARTRGSRPVPASRSRRSYHDACRRRHGSFLGHDGGAHRVMRLASCSCRRSSTGGRSA
jgi:hypothetical protein